MEVGDLVRHRNDGDIGIVIGTRDPSEARSWSVEVAWITSDYAGASDWYNPFILEILSDPR